jgi:dihydroxy-acid dehydratase
MALGGSTNAVIHLTAIAGRLGIRIPMARFNELSDETPVLVDLKPVGEGYMEDFYAAGGVVALLRELGPLLHIDCIGVDGVTLRERLEAPQDWVDHTVIRPFDQPILTIGGLIALTGRLAPEGAIFKRAAATPDLFEVEGRAVVFDGLEDWLGASMIPNSTSSPTECRSQASTGSRHRRRLMRSRHEPWDW